MKYLIVFAAGLAFGYLVFSPLELTDAERMFLNQP